MRISDWSSDVCSSDLKARIDFDEQRAPGGDRIERPQRYPARQPVQQAHPGKAGLADLRRADEVEIADARRLFRRALILFDDPEATRAGREKIADFAAAVAKMAPRVGMREKGAGFIMRIAAGEPLDQRPKRPNIDGALAPLGKIGARVGEGEGGREIETDQHILARGCNALQPGEY